MKPSRILLIDIVAAAVYLVAANPDVTGLAIHEWVSSGVFVVLVVHAAQHYDWIIETLKKSGERRTPARVGRLVLDILTVVTFMVVTVSGLMVSRFILPLFDLVAPGYFFWNPLHSISAKVLLALLVIHVVVNIGKVIAMIRSRDKSGRDSDSDRDD